VTILLHDLWHVDNLLLHHWDWEVHDLLDELLRDALLSNDLRHVDDLLNHHWHRDVDNLLDLAVLHALLRNDLRHVHDLLHLHNLHLLNDALLDDLLDSRNLHDLLPDLARDHLVLVLLVLVLLFQRTCGSSRPAPAMALRTISRFILFPEAIVLAASKPPTLD
jgi:hypothetical protein